MRGRRLGSVVAAVALTAMVGCSSDDGGSHAAPPSSTTTRAALVAPPPATVATDVGPVDLACEGRGAVPVVLVPGGSDRAERWDDLVTALGGDVLTCRFDAGGRSTDGAFSPKALADALDRALDDVGLRGPVVLVGHSLGGLTVRQLGADHPDRVAGALLLDPTTPLALLSVADEMAADGWDVAATQQAAAAAVTWPDVSLVVLSHDPAGLTLGDETVEQLWTDGQREYAALTPRGTAHAVAGSGHYVDRDAPEEVVATIRRIIGESD